MAKSKKGATLWYKCENCQAHVVLKDTETHVSNCPPVLDKFIHPFVLNSVLYGTLDIKSNEEIKGITYHDKNNFVFLSQTAIQLCNLVIGEWAVVRTPENNIAPCARIAWPSTEKSLSSVLITQSAFDLTWKSKSILNVMVSKLDISSVKEASEVVILFDNSPKMLQLSQELILRLKKLHLNRFIAVGNKICTMFYGKLLEFSVKNIVASEQRVHASYDIIRNLENEFKEMTIDDDMFHKITDATVFKIYMNEKEKESLPKLLVDYMCAIGGLRSEISEIKDLVDVATGKVSRAPGLKCTRGILLYGPSGTGKTMVARAIAKTSGCNTVTINGPDLYSKYVGEAESTLINLFRKAIEQAPSIVLLDEVDVLCPSRSTRLSDQEKRVVATILMQLDKLCDSKVCILATSNRPDSIDPAFRRCGRLEREIEIPIPNPQARFEILYKELSKTKHSISDECLHEIAYGAHGFVGSDLMSLCSRAGMHASNQELTADDFKFALTHVRPSAMREVQVEVPNVKWSDIGGQHHLKLVLKQSVEWPLKHSESFIRMGITPPRGVLMFGPPGCSKTMIAKALATESQLNFLSVKGPELFSKWVGESERAVREVFRKARQVAPSIVFFDEIDALGAERAGVGSGSASVQERVLAQLLTELDGVTPLGDVTVLAASNRPDRIDKALLRPGRLDRIVYVPLPDDATRREIFELKLKRMPVTDVAIDALVRVSEGYSGAEIQAVCHEAAMKALEEDIQAKHVTDKHFSQAFKTITPRTPASLLKIYEDYLQNNL